MIGHQLQGFSEAEADYRHTQLMAMAGQIIVERPRKHRLHALISRSRHGHRSAR